MAALGDAVGLGNVIGLGSVVVLGKYGSFEKCGRFGKNGKRQSKNLFGLFRASIMTEPAFSNFPGGMTVCVHRNFEGLDIERMNNG